MFVLISLLTSAGEVNGISTLSCRTTWSHIWGENTAVLHTVLIYDAVGINCQTFRDIYSMFKNKTNSVAISPQANYTNQSTITASKASADFNG
jgi:hypothetical protein